MPDRTSFINPGRRFLGPWARPALGVGLVLGLTLLFAGCGTSGSVPAGGSSTPAPTVTIAANPASVTASDPATLTVTATNATSVTVTGTDGSSYTLQPAGGTQRSQPVSDHDIHRNRDWSGR